MINIEPLNPSHGFHDVVKYSSHGPAFVGIWNGTPIGAAGIVILWDGLGEGWSVASSQGKYHPVAFHRAVKMMMNKCIKSHSIRRLQISVDVESPSSIIWVTMLGFKLESIMPKFGPKGETFARFVMFTREDK